MTTNEVVLECDSINLVQVLDKKIVDVLTPKLTQPQTPDKDDLLSEEKPKG